MTRSNEYEQGYRAAWRDAIAHVHSLGDQMNEVKAKHCIYGVAFSLGNLKGFNVPPFAPDKEPEYRAGQGVSEPTFPVKL